MATGAATAAVVCLVFAVWQIIQIVRWPEGRALTDELDRLRRDELNDMAEAYTRDMEREA